MIFGQDRNYLPKADDGLINFSSTVWSGGNIEKLEEHLIKNIECITRYPEADAGTLRQMLARRVGVDKDSIMVSNGPTAAFYLIAQAFNGARSMIISPSFAEYEEACKMYDHKLSYYPSSGDIMEMDLSNQDFCWLCNPNNPDGKLIYRNELIRLIDSNPDVNFVLDQSYVNYSTEEMISHADIKKRKNLILVYSFSHAYGIPGLRVGYIIAPKTITQKIAKYFVPWTIDALAIEAAKFILIHPAQFTLPIRKWQRNTDDLVAALQRLDGLEVLPTSSTFFLMKLRNEKAADLKEYLMNEHKILVRNASKFRGLDDSFLRITAQSPAENDKLVAAIEAFLDRNKEA